MASKESLFASIRGKLAPATDTVNEQLFVGSVGNDPSLGDVGPLLPGTLPGK